MITTYPSTPEEMRRRTPFFAMYFISTISSALLLFIFCVGKLKRHWTIKSLFLALVLNGIINLLRLRNDPPEALAIFIAAGSLAGIVANCSTATALVFRTWFIVVFTLGDHRVVHILEISSLVVPWVASIATFVGVVIVRSKLLGARHRRVDRLPLAKTTLTPFSFLLPRWSKSCALRPNNVVLSTFSAAPRLGLDNHAPRVVGLVFLGLTMVFEIWTVLSILRRQPLIHIKDASPSALSLEPDREVKSRRSPFDRPLTFRVLIYGVWLAGGFGMLVWICLSSTSIPIMYQSTAGICASLVFASQRDVLEFFHLLKPTTTTFMPLSVAEQLKTTTRLQTLNSRRQSYMGGYGADVNSGWNSEGSATGDVPKKTRSSSSGGVETLGGIGDDDDGGGMTFEEMLDGG
ncbi:hypothetical protein BDY24DRAFT_400315 [Mrakia frigida]|uniref:uncharacterized protein n=1 Tax=Mrakia frigida TaxID=29902 RepID=UPI003FCC2578